MSCGWKLIDWEFESRIGGVTIKDTPDICKECEFFNICFMNRTSSILGMPMWLGEEAMRQLVYLNRLQAEWADEELIWAYIESICSIHIKQ